MTAILNPVRRFTASNARPETVSREEFAALEEKVDSLLEEVDSILSPANLTSAIETAVRPVLDELDARKETKVANRSSVRGRFQAPPGDDTVDSAQVSNSRAQPKSRFTAPAGE